MIFSSSSSWCSCCCCSISSSSSSSSKVVSLSSLSSSLPSLHSTSPPSSSPVSSPQKQLSPTYSTVCSNLYIASSSHDNAGWSTFCVHDNGSMGCELSIIMLSL